MASDTMQKIVRNYENMRDSGVEWIGAIPNHWKTTRMKAIFRVKSVKNHPNAEVLSLYRDFGILPKSSRDDNHNVTSEDTSQYKYVEKDNLVINKMKAWQGSLAISEHEGIVSPAYYVCEFRSAAVDKKYIHHLLRCAAYAQEFERLSTGMRIGQWDLGIDDFMFVPVVLPTLNEQKHIGHYLDVQCLKIDTIISDAKNSIEEYKAWKTSIIYEAVTKGLNPNVDMKDSGVEWTREIPSTWKIIRLKFLGSARNGLTYTPSDISDKNNGTLVLRSSNIQNGALSFDDNVYVSSNIPEQLWLRQGDIVICSRNGSKALIGKNAYIESDISASFGAFMMVFRSFIPESKYVYWLLNSGVFGYYLGAYSTTTINQLTRENINNMYVPFCPDPVTRRNIALYLDKKCSEIDKVIAQKNSLISDLEAYKKSLIFEVVTGKRKVV